MVRETKQKGDWEAQRADAAEALSVMGLWTTVSPRLGHNSAGRQGLLSE